MFNGPIFIVENKKDFVNALITVLEYEFSDDGILTEQEVSRLAKLHTKLTKKKKTNVIG